MGSAKCHDEEVCGMLRDPTVEAPKPAEDGEKGHVQGVFPGGVKSLAGKGVPGKGNSRIKGSECEETWHIVGPGAFKGLEGYGSRGCTRGWAI